MLNPRLVSMLGFSRPEDLLGSDPWEYVHPGDHEMVKSGGWLRQHHDVSQRHYNFRAICGDGKTIWLEALDTHIMYEGRKANLGNVVDITQRKATEEAMKQSEEQYRLLVDNAQDAIYILQDGVFVFANPEVERLIGYTQEELLSLDFRKVIHPDHLPEVSQRYADRLRGKAALNDYPMRVLAKDGSERWIQTKGILISWKERPALLYTSRDITSQRAMESQLRQSQKLEAIGHPGRWHRPRLQQHAGRHHGLYRVEPGRCRCRQRTGPKSGAGNEGSVSGAEAWCNRSSLSDRGAERETESPWTWRL